MRFLFCIVFVLLIIGARVLWVRTHRATPFYVRVTGIGTVMMELGDSEGMSGFPFGNSESPRLVRYLPRGSYALVFERQEGQDFCLALGYAGTYRERLDLDVSSSTAQDQWHVRLMADDTTVLFESDVPFNNATDKRPCIIRL